MDASHLEFSGLHYCLFVKVLRIWLSALFVTALIDYHNLSQLVKHLFKYFFKKF